MSDSAPVRDVPDGMTARVLNILGIAVISSGITIFALRAWAPPRVPDVGLCEELCARRSEIRRMQKDLTALRRALKLRSPHPEVSP